MKIFFVVVLALLTSLGNSIQAAQTADARMYCLSIRFGKANAGGPNGLYSLELTGINSDINGELYPVFGAPRTHHTFLVMTDDLFEEEFPGDMLLNVPTTDSNGDGFPDIFDTSLAFSGGSSGTYSIPNFFNGNVNASWQRSAGSHAGTCQLNFQGIGSFTHTFNILEYRGPLTYTPGTSVVTGDVNLDLTGVPGFELDGPVQFTKSAGNPSNILKIEEGAWTNSVPETFSFLTNTLTRDPTWPTNYYSYFEFDDWLLSTFEPDYYLWVISIDDLNDADSDGIPDFSDNPQVVVPRRPLLGLARTQNNVQLSISGDIGQVCQIQQSSTVEATTWPTISSVTLTNDPQTVSLPLPSGTAFWRVRVQ